MVNHRNAMIFLFGFLALAASHTGLFAQVTVPATKITHAQLNFVDISLATTGSPAAIAKSKINQLYIENRNTRLVEFFFQYNKEIKFNDEFRMWMNRSHHRYLGGNAIEISLPKALEWVGEWQAKTLNFRWFSAGHGQVNQEVLQTAVDAVTTFDFYLVGHEEALANDSALVQSIKDLASANPSKVRMHRVAREVEIKFIE